MARRARPPRRSTGAKLGTFFGDVLGGLEQGVERREERRRRQEDLALRKAEQESVERHRKGQRVQRSEEFARRASQEPTPAEREREAAFQERKQELRGRELDIRADELEARRRKVSQPQKTTAQLTSKDKEFLNQSMLTFDPEVPAERLPISVPSREILASPDVVKINPDANPAAYYAAVLKTVQEKMASIGTDEFPAFGRPPKGYELEWSNQVASWIIENSEVLGRPLSEATKEKMDEQTGWRAWLAGVIGRFRGGGQEPQSDILDIEAELGA